MNQNDTMMNLTGPGPGGQGPAISGKFFHKDTGKEIFVRDSINDGVKMCVVLSDGTTMDMSEFQNYVQMSEEEYDSQGRLIGKTKEQEKPSLDPDLLFAGLGDRPKESTKQSEEIRSVMKQIEEPNIREYSEDNQKLSMIILQYRFIVKRIQMPILLVLKILKEKHMLDGEHQVKKQSFRRL